MKQAQVTIKERKVQEQRAAVRSRSRTRPSQSTLLSGLSAWQWTAVAILVAAAILRLLQLTVKPLHHDEGVNGMFLTGLFRGGAYHYDPANYHGPTLYYFALITTTVNSLFYGKEGLSTFAIRLVTALFGMGVVWLMFCLRKQIGTQGAFFAAALATVSPGFVFFSRYFIHEILFVFFTLGVIVAWLHYWEKREPLYLFLASASAALLCATKETWIITVAVWLIALACTEGYFRLRGRPAVERSLVNSESELSTHLWVTAAAIFVAIWVVFYSSFFTNFPKGVYDSIATFGPWFKTGEQSKWVAPWYTYFSWMLQAEAPVMILGLLGCIIAFVDARNRFAAFTAFWTLGMLSAYSLVPYKTPWLVLNIVLPLIIMAGYGLQQMFSPGLRAFTAAIAGAAVAFSLYQAIDLSFFHYDDDTKTYVYAHTTRDFLSLVNEINSIAAGRPEGKNIDIDVMSTEHWPLYWYLRDYPHAAYPGRVEETNAPIVIALESQQLEVARLLDGRYRLYSRHELRPGNILYTYLRRDIQP